MQRKKFYPAKEIFAFRPETNNVDGLSGSYVRASLFCNCLTPITLFIFIYFMPINFMQYGNFTITMQYGNFVLNFIMLGNFMQYGNLKFYYDEKFYFYVVWKLLNFILINFILNFITTMQYGNLPLLIFLLLLFFKFLFLPLFMPFLPFLLIFLPLLLIFLLILLIFLLAVKFLLLLLLATELKGMRPGQKLLFFKSYYII